MTHEESQIQRNCITWFRYEYPHLTPLCFAVPNGGVRSKREAAIMKAEGVTAGVADVILLMSRKGFTSLCIEFKTEKGRQSESQKRWQLAVEHNGIKYAIVRSVDDFINVINDYLDGQ